MSADGKVTLPSAFIPGSDEETQILTPVTINESPWITSMCEGAENNRWTVSAVGDVISDMGMKLLPPALSEDIRPCPYASSDATNCGYELYFIDEDTPWVAYRGKWGGSNKKIPGPDEDTRWNTPHVWALLCMAYSPYCMEKFSERMLGMGDDTKP